MSTFPKYLNLRVTASVRLGALRAINYDNWRKAREWTFANAQAAYCHELNQGFNGNDRHKARIWYTFTGEYFRNEKDAHEILDLRHTGWFCDPEGDSKAIGIVARLPHGKFIAGYTLTVNDERVYFDEIHTSEFEAAKMADEHARVYAEAEYEHQAKWSRARDIEDEIESQLRRLRECIVLRHDECMAYVRKEIPRLIGSIRDARDDLATNYKDVL